VKSYRQWCALAKALDAVGERWTLLVVRELLDGSKRYTDLQADIPGISTDVLASRLKDLEASGVVRRSRLPPPAASKVYELTEMGRGLAPAVMALTKWGMQLLGDRADDEAFRPHWLALGLQGLLRADRAKDVTLDIDFDLGSGEVVRIRVDDGALRFVPHPENEADVVVRAELGTLAALADGSLVARDARTDGRLVIEGSRASIREYGQLFPQPS
jgi:DNA-binding HxlR family transcriptional regulator